jgi:anti-sigma factor RsiW
MAPEPICDRIEDYLDDVLAEAERESMERHLETCGDCRLAVEEYRRLRRLALAVPPVEIPDDLAFRIRRRLSGTTPPRRRPARVLRPVAFAAAAVLLVAVLIRPEPEMPPPKGPATGGDRAYAAAPEDIESSVADWLVQAGNASEDDRDRLLAEAREHRLLARVRAAIPAVRGTERDAWLTAVSDLLVQLENDPGTGALREEARFVAMVRPR